MPISVPSHVSSTAEQLRSESEKAQLIVVTRNDTAEVLAAMKHRERLVGDLYLEDSARPKPAPVEVVPTPRPIDPKYERHPRQRVLDTPELMAQQESEYVFLPEAWKVARIQVGTGTIRELRDELEVPPHSAALFEMPLQDADKGVDAYFLFTDEDVMHRAMTALAKKHETGLRYGMQSEGRVWITNRGTPFTSGPGMIQAGMLNNPPLSPEKIARAEAKGAAQGFIKSPSLTEFVDPDKKTRERQAVEGVGCSVKIVFDIGQPGCDQAFAPIYQIMSRYDATGVTSLSAREIEFVSKEKWGAVGATLQRLAQSPYGQYFWATVIEDEFETEESDHAAGPRLIRTQNRNVMNAFHPDLSMPKGVYLQNRALHLASQSDRVGASIRPSMAQLPDDQDAFVHLAELSELINRINVKGAATLIGRNKEIETAKESLKLLKKGGTVNFVLEGPAGSGKTRLAKEIIDKAIRNYGVKRVFALKAPEPQYSLTADSKDPEAAKVPYLLTHALVQQILEQYLQINFSDGKIPPHLKDLQDLYSVLNGTQANPALVERLQDPAQCAAVIHAACRVLGGTSAFVLDDLQWWHNKKDAAVISQLKRLHEAGRDSTLFMDLSRTDEADFVPNAKQGIDFFESPQGAKLTGATVTRIRTGELVFINQSGKPNKNFLEYVVSSFPAEVQEGLRAKFKETPVVLEIMARLACGPGKVSALPADVGEILQWLQQNGQIVLEPVIAIALDPDLTSGTGKRRMANIVMQQIRQKRIEHLASQSPYLMGLCEIITLFGGEIIPSLLKAVAGKEHQEASMGESLRILQKKNIVIPAEGGRVRFDDLMGEAMERHFAGDLPKKAHALYKKLKDLCNTNGDVRETIAFHHPALFATLLQRALKDESISPDERKTIMGRAVEHGAGALNILFFQGKFDEAATLGSWAAGLKDGPEKLIDNRLTPAKRLGFHMNLMESWARSGNYDAMVSTTGEVEKSLQALETDDRARMDRWFDRARMFAIRIEGLYKANRTKDLEGIVLHYQAHIDWLKRQFGWDGEELTPVKYEPEHIPHVLQLAIAQGKLQLAKGYTAKGETVTIWDVQRKKLGDYEMMYDQKAYDRSRMEFQTGMGILMRGVNEAFKLLEEMPKEGPEAVQLRQIIERKLTEAKHISAQLRVMHELRNRRRIDQQVAYVLDPIKSQQLEKAVEIYKELLPDEEKEEKEKGKKKTTFFDNVEIEGNAHLYYAQAILFMNGLGPFRDEVEKMDAFQAHLQKATAVGRENFNSISFREREVADILVGIQMRNPEKITAFEVDGIVKRYDRAIEHLTRIPEDKREEPKDKKDREYQRKKAEYEECQRKKLLRAELDESLSGTHFPLRPRFCDAAANKADWMIYAARLTKGKAEGQKIPNVPEYRTPEKVTEALQHIIAAIYIKAGGNPDGITAKEMPEYSQDYLPTLGHCLMMANELGISLPKDKVSQKVLSWAIQKGTEANALMSRKYDHFTRADADPILRANADPMSIKILERRLEGLGGLAFAI